MDIRIPEPLKVEHEELHVELVALTKAPGKVGEAARNVAVLLQHPHLEMRAVLAMTEALLLLATVIFGGSIAHTMMRDPSTGAVVNCTLQANQAEENPIAQVAAERQCAAGYKAAGYQCVQGQCQ
jgi:hypothetical protein